MLTFKKSCWFLHELLSHIDIYIVFYVRPSIKSTVHPFTYVCVKPTQILTLAYFPLRLYVVRKPLHRIFLLAKVFARKKTHVREEEEKRENIAQSSLNRIQLIK